MNKKTALLTVRMDLTGACFGEQIPKESWILVRRVGLVNEMEPLVGQIEQVFEFSKVHLHKVMLLWHEQLVVVVKRKQVGGRV